MTMGFLEWIAGIGGVGAVFAVLMFFIYRHDRKAAEDRAREDRKFMEDRLTSVLDAYNKVTQENIKIQSEVLTWLRARNGK